MRLPAAIELVRLHNCLFAGIGVVIGALIASRGVFAPKIVLAFLAAALISGAGNAINDYSDRRIDAANRPWRPIPSKRIKVSTALELSQVLFVGGIMAAVFINPYCVLLAGFNGVVLAVYASHLKRRGLAGNLAIGYLVGSTFLFGGLAVGELGAVSVLAAMAALATVGRELIKDVEDMRGDRKLGMRTFPLLYGRRTAAGLAGVFTIAAISLSPLPYLLGLFGWPYLAVVWASVAAFVAGAAIIARRQRKREARRASLIYKVAMGLGLLAFLVGALA